MASKCAKKLIIDSYKKQLKKQMHEKYAKKGLLKKICESNKKRTNALVEILKESDNLNTMNSESFRSSDSSGARKSNDDEHFLKKYYQTQTGGPKHSIALNRAHHLTNFLTEYILNAFQSGHFETPDFTSLRLDPKTEDYFFELSRIELLADLSAIKVYWFNSGTEKIDNFVEEFLDKKLRGQIRHTLINERVMNYVPRVVFVRDETNALIKQLDESLAKIKCETSQYDEETGENKSENEIISSKSGPNSGKDSLQSVKKTVNNLYGVDFNRLLEKIRSGNGIDYTKWSNQSESSPSSKHSLTEFKSSGLALDAAMAQIEQKKFESSLKAYQLNRKLKMERANKSGLLKLCHLELDEFKNTHL